MNKPRSYPEQQASEIVKKSTSLMEKARAPGLVAVFAEGRVVFAHAGMEPDDALRLLEELKRQLTASHARGDIGSTEAP